MGFLTIISGDDPVMDQLIQQMKPEVKVAITIIYSLYNIDINNPSFNLLVIGYIIIIL